MKEKNKDQAHHQQQNQYQLSFPDVTPLDHVKMCPRYTSILNRADGVGVGIEEMDYLQMEIESLLVNIMQRSRQLKLETLILENESGKTDASSALNLVASNQSATTSQLQKSSSLNTNSPNISSDKFASNLQKKFKSFNGKPTTQQSNKNQPFINQDSNQIYQQPIIRNEIPDLFWQSVEPYCADITEEDIKLLETQLELNEKYLNVNKLGPLGKHYSLQWAQEDINHQIRDGSRFVDLDQTITNSNNSITPKLNASVSQKRKAISPLNSNDDNFKKMSESKSLLDESLIKLNSKKSSSLAYGPLTQRLIAALVEQNLTPYESDITDYLDRIYPPQSMYMSPKTIAKKFNFGSSSSAASAMSSQSVAASSSLERKIKKTLIEQGMLDLDENDKSEMSSSEKNGPCSTLASLAISFGSNNNNNNNPSNESANSDLAKDVSIHAVGNGGDESFSKDDEIANEIKNLQNELRTVTNQCKQTLTHLLQLSKHNMTKQNIRKKITTVDNDIIDMFEKFKSMRSARKPVTKKDKDKALRLIKDRQMLCSRLNEIKE